MSNAANSSTWSLTKIGLLGSAILLATAVASAFYKGNGSVVNETNGAGANAAGGNRSASPAMPASPANPVALPANVSEASINLLDGKATKFSEYKGKVLIVDLWATWCGPCRQEIPHLIELANKYKSEGVEVIGLTNEDPTADAEKVRAFSKEFKINYPIGWADPELALGIMRLGGRPGIPQTLIIGRDGRVRNHFVGFSAQISVPQMNAALAEALKAG